MSAGSRKKRQSASQSIGGVLFGFEQQVLRTTPPPQELVHHARPDLPIAGADGEPLTLELPDELELDDPWAGIEDELADDDDPWAEYAAEASAGADGAGGDDADGTGPADGRDGARGSAERS
ncbi:MAG TPA: hypothetical protein VFY23_04095 [Candidatus Limnocylindrales bacterium]|nr:hypothetical protein [Candidatus Limnocylindrales bacterium]